ncbi:MAG: LuxR C-terminal-related transcriptional regulator [Candidatus Velthaea sp.]
MLEEAVRTAILGTHEEIRASAAAAARDSPDAVVFRAALAQRGGDVAEATRLLTRLEHDLADAERAALIELYVPLLISVGDLERAEHLVLEAAPSDAGARAGIAALAAVIAAQRGEFEVSAAAAERAREILVFTDDEYRRATVLQRLSLAAFYRNEYLDAMDLGLSSVKAAEGAGFMRYAAVAYTVPYAVAHDVLGDPRLALYYAERTAIVARAASDDSYVRNGLASQAIVAAESGDRRRLQVLSTRLISARNARQFREQFVIALALALPLAWDGEFEQFASTIATLREGRGASERALCDALLAVCASARGDLEEARRRTRSALHLTRRLPDSPAYDEQRRRVARAVAAVVCNRIGDRIRGERALHGKDMAGTPEASLASDGKRAPIVAGYGMVLDAAARSVKPAGDASLLTTAQMALLRELASGKTIPQISKEAGRSVATLRTHAQQINDRLGVHGRAAAITRGRELGLI